MFFWGPFIEDLFKSLLSGESMKFSGIFQKFALKYENIDKVTEKCNIFQKISFFASNWKNNYIYVWAIIEVQGEATP